MECNMKQRPDPEIVEEIVTELGGRALRNSEAQAGVERWIELLRGPGKEEVFPVATFGENEAAAKWENRDWYFRDGPHAASIRKAARNLRKALKPFSGALQASRRGPAQDAAPGIPMCLGLARAHRGAAGKVLARNILPSSEPIAWSLNIHKGRRPGHLAARFVILPPSSIKLSPARRLI
jgi:hypothetical protein